MKGKMKCGVVVACSVALVAGAQQHTFIGARASGMGGANAASTRDATAQWHNPAAFGFMHQSRDVEEEPVYYAPVAETNTVAEYAEASTVVETNRVTEVEEFVAAETNALIHVEEEAASTNDLLMTVGSTNIVQEALVESNAVVVAVDAPAPTNAAPVSSPAASAQEDADESVIETNAVIVAPETDVPTNTLPVDVVAVDVVNDVFAERAADPAIPVFGALGPDEESFNLLDNNGLADKDFGWNVLDLNLGYTMTEDMGRYVDVLADIAFDAFDSGTLGSTPDNVKSLLALTGILSGLSEGNDSLYVDSSVGTSVRIGHFGVGIRLFGEVAATVQPDVDRLALDGYTGIGDLVTELNNAAGIDPNFTGGPGYTFTTLSSQQQTDLFTTLGDNNAVQYVDAKLGDLISAGDLVGDEIQGTVDTIGNLVGADSIDSNLTSVAAQGFAAVEVPVSYGRAINDHLSVGATAKAIFGQVLGTRVWVFDEDNIDNAIESVSDTEANTLAFGLDLGALYRINNFQFAVVGHNLNTPTFDGYDDAVLVNGSNVVINVPDVTLDPQVTVGAAFIPSKRFMLEVNYDLLETGTLLKGYDIQRLSVGGEVDLWALALRVGAYSNLAAEEQYWVATAGVGLNIFGLRADIGGAYSLGENAEYDGTEIPSEARLFLSVGLDY